MRKLMLVILLGLMAQVVFAVENALHFDGINDYVNISSAVTAPTTTQAVTIEAWVFPTTNSDYRLIASKYVGGISSSCNFLLTRKPDQKLYISGNGTNVITSNGIAPLNLWTHVAVVYQSGTNNTKIYINGNLDISGTLTYNTSNSSTAMQIGQFSNITSYPVYQEWTGKIDEFRLWNTVRTQAQIYENMNAPLTGSETGLVAYYGFNQGTANGTNTGITTLSDLTGHGWNGTLTNFALTGTTSNWVEGALETDPPSAPAASSATDIGATSFTANWNAATGASGYYIDVATDSGFLNYVTGYQDKNVYNVTSSAITGLNIDTDYFYRIRAYNSAGTSGNSNTVSARTIYVDLPDTPVALDATEVSFLRFNASWTVSPDATGYYLDVATNATFTAFVTGYNGKDVGNLTGITVTGLAMNTDYHYRVRAYNTEGTGSNSNSISLKTLYAPAPVEVRPAGDGGYDNPFQIATLNNLYWLRRNSSYWDNGYYYTQTADIDAASTELWYSGSGFNPIGDSDDVFTGTYDGNGKKITNLYINRPDVYRVGFFGSTLGGEVKNLYIQDANITGYISAAGLIGYSDGTLVKECCVSGVVNGYKNTGGLTGASINSAQIYDSYSKCSVTGGQFTGGLTGYNSTGSTVVKCYSAGPVSGTTYTGGLIGHNSATVAGSLWDIEASGQASSSGGTGKTTAEMQNLITFTNEGWDFYGESSNGTEDIWEMQISMNNGYPIFNRQYLEFTEVTGTGFQQIAESTCDWGDYDNDGDLDLAVSGDGFAAVYSNDDGVFTNINAGLTGLEKGATQWGDYDNDGDLDLLISGRKPYGDGYIYIYRNDNGTFVKTVPDIPGTKLGGSAWIDFDGDGDLDIAHSGYSSEGRIAGIYRNDNGVFSDANVGFTGVDESSVTCADYDNDGDTDVLITGYFYNGSVNVTAKLYRNNGDGTFTDSGSNLTGVRYGAAAWGDYDNDGDLDLIINGYPSAAWPDYVALTKLYRNDSGVFTSVDSGLQNTGMGSLDWGDFDNDGDLDLLMTGRNGATNFTKIYQNSGGSFTAVNSYLSDVYYGFADWADYDNDGDLDILLSGSNGTAGITKLYKNNSETANSLPTVPTGLNFSADGNTADFSWTKSTDSETPQNGLTYNIFIRPVNQNHFVKSPMSDTQTGYRKIVCTGNTGANNFYTFGNLPDGRYGWSVQAVDHAFAGSGFAEEQVISVGNVPDPPTAPAALPATHKGINTFRANWEASAGGESYNLDVATDSGFENIVFGYDNLDVGNVTGFRVLGLEMNTIYYFRVRAFNAGGTSGYSNVRSIRTGYSSFTEITTALPGTELGDASWGDYDNDGDLDIVLAAEKSSSINQSNRIFRYENGTFTDINAGLTAINLASVEWGDYDNDGYLDILSIGRNGSNPVSIVYHNNGDNTFTDINAGLQGVNSGSCAWGDYDNDGDLDILLTGATGSINVSKVYRNNGDNTFTDINAGLTGGYFTSCSWCDFDNDSDLDILISGYSGSSYFSNLYRNNGDNTFTDINAGLQGVYLGSSVWGDYDSDGDQDILLTGGVGNTRYSIIYRNNGDNTFTNINAGLTPMYDGEAGWGDFDNDGDLDIWMSGSASSGRISKIFQNCEGEFIDAGLEIIGLSSSFCAWGDYDSDGDLDMVISGYDGASYITKLYRNNRTALNTAPSAPENLSTLVNGSDLTLIWGKSTDTETPQAGLSYNIYLGTWRDKISTASPMSSTGSGLRRIVNYGNAGQSGSWKINDLPDGEYVWSVQAVDNCFTGSAFAGEQSFIIGSVVEAPAVPVALEETEMTESSFKANWNAAVRAEGYYLDVATDADFTSYVPGYQNKDVENVQTFAVTGLNTAVTHYYRLRSYNYSGTSPNSNVISVQRAIGQITVISPNGNEELPSNALYEIKWTDDISENVRIELYKYDEYLSTVVESTPSDGSYMWDIPEVLTGKYFRIRIVSGSYEYINDQSDNRFNITAEAQTAKLTQAITDDWNSNTMSWVKDDRVLHTYYPDGRIDDWLYQNYSITTGTYETDPDYSYYSTYYTDHYRMINTYSYGGWYPGKPSYYYWKETTLKYNLEGRHDATYVHITEDNDGDQSEEITDTYYNYIGDLLDNVYVVCTNNPGIDPRYKTYYAYDSYNRNISQNFHDYTTSEMLERTNLTYNASERKNEAVKEKKVNGIWTNYSKIISYSDNYDRVRRKETYSWSNYSWRPTNLDSLYYYDEGQTKRKVKYYYNSTTQQYQRTEKTDYIYDDPDLSVQPAGTGIESDPYTITNIDELKWIATNPRKWDRYFIQANDIDASGTVLFNGGTGWTPIGNTTTKFSGHYDGQGHSISGLFIYLPSVSGAGLFGRTLNAEIKNINLTNVNITGSTSSGAIVGYGDATAVTNCTASGSVTGVNNVGGIVGANLNSSVISRCAAFCSVTGTKYAGGLAGYNSVSSVISDSYAQGSVACTDYAGGFLGYNNNTSSVNRCYSTGAVTGAGVCGGFVAGNVNGSSVNGCLWDTDTSGQATSAGGTGKTKVEMQRRITYTSAGWDYICESANGTADIWNIDGVNNNGYAYYSQYFMAPSSGDGTEGNPYRIATLNNIYWISADAGRWEYHYIQSSDINATVTDEWHEGAGFIPIGNATLKFTGNYDGQGFVIEGLYINRPALSGAGLFGRTLNSEIRNVNIANAEITGGNSTGAIAGYGDATTITNCLTSGIVTGVNNSGGIAGSIINGSLITRCGSLCAVTGVNYTGGVTGYNTTNSAVSLSYSKGGVSGFDYVGGIAGRNHITSTVTDCYFKGSVSGHSYVGGVAGLNSYSSVLHNSYAASTVAGTGYYKGGGLGYNDGATSAVVQNVLFDSDLSGLGSSQGCIARTTAQMKDILTYTSRTWDFVGDITNGLNDYWDMSGTDNEGYPFLSWQVFELIRPQNLKISSTSQSSLITWTDSAGAAYYKIYSTDDPYASFPAGWTLETSVSGTNWTDTDMTAERKFYVVVSVSAKEAEQETKKIIKRRNDR
jgi:hypothetical protein